MWRCGADGGPSANGSPAKGTVGLRRQFARLAAGLELRDRGRAALISLRDLRRPRISATAVGVLVRSVRGGSARRPDSLQQVPQRNQRSPPRIQALQQRNCLAEPSHTTRALGGRAIRGGASPRPASRRIGNQMPIAASDLTFPPEWLNFPALRAEGCALETRSSCGLPGWPRPEGLAPSFRATRGPAQLPVEPPRSSRGVIG